MGLPILSGDGVVAMPMCQFGSLAGPLPQKIKLGPAFLTAPDRLNVQHVRRMQRENALHTFVIDDSPNGKGFINTPAFPADHRPGKDLRALLVALPDPTVNVHHVPNLEMRDIVLQTRAFNGI